MAAVACLNADAFDEGQQAACEGKVEERRVHPSEERKSVHQGKVVVSMYYVRYVVQSLCLDPMTSFCTLAFFWKYQSTSFIHS